MVGQLQHLAPTIFTTPSKDGTLFMCSEKFVAKFIRRALGWSIRRSTRPGRKIPANADAILMKSFLRMAHIIKEHEIPSALIVNGDQTQLVLAQGCNMTYAPKGSTQVATVGADEKRAITVFIMVSNDGVLLPFQAIYKGTSNLSLPRKNASGMDEVVRLQFRIESSMTKTYWSTQATMRNYVDYVLAPYYARRKTELNLPQEQKSICHLDCWSVHRSDEFLDWMRATHPTIIVTFVPANLTGLGQPCDVGINRTFKHSTKKSAHQDVVHEVYEQLKNGVSGQDATMDSKIKTLRDRTVGWLVNAYKALDKPELVKKVRVKSAIDLSHP